MREENEDAGRTPAIVLADNKPTTLEDRPKCTCTRGRMTAVSHQPYTGPPQLSHWAEL
jgi:hypothetical protein